MKTRAPRALGGELRSTKGPSSAGSHACHPASGWRAAGAAHPGPQQGGATKCLLQPQPQTGNPLPLAKGKSDPGPPRGCWPL